MQKIPEPERSKGEYKEKRTVNRNEKKMMREVWELQEMGEENENKDKMGKVETKDNGKVRKAEREVKRERRGESGKT